MLTRDRTLYVWPVAIRETDGTRTTIRFSSLTAAREAARLLNSCPNVESAYTLSPKLKTEYRPSC
jgi:hypothetical protein